MSKPLVILGAGASYDYIPENERPSDRAQWRPPLAKDLFDPNRFENIIAQFDELGGLASSVLNQLARGANIEEYLKKLQDRILENATDKEHLKGQLGASLFYFQKLFEEISKNYSRSTNNYQDLINYLQQVGGGCVVSFNYDTLFDKALRIKEAPKGKYENLYSYLDYIQGPIKLIKVHGSWDWKYILDSSPFRFRDVESPYDYVIKGYDRLIQAHGTKIPTQGVKTIERGRDILKTVDYTVSVGNGEKLNLYPAIAIPLANKDMFVCPERHLLILQSELEQTDRILIIGWKAADDHLLEMMRDNLKQPNVRIVLVLGKNGDTQAVKRIHEIVALQRPHLNIQIEDTRSTFSDFLRSNLVDSFFGIS